MKRTEVAKSQEAEAARSIAPEDLQVGDFVAVASRVVELASYLWTNDSHTLPPDELVRLQCVVRNAGTPLKVKAVCLPFLMVKSPRGRHRILDVRQHRLVRLSRKYAKQVWRAMR